MPDMKTLTINGITYNINDNNLNNLLDGSAIGSLHSINSNESNSYTIGQYATALGGDVKASGNFSTALNFGTTAAGNSQTVIGKYNIIDTNDTSAFIIGNGTADDARSNALTVDWKGWVSLYHNDAIVNTTPTIPSKTSYREIMFRDGSFVYNDTHRTGMIGNSVDTNGTTGTYLKATRLNATAGPNGSTEVAIGAYYPLTGDPYVHAGKKLVIGGVTEASNAYGSANPILEFRNNAGDGTQNIQLIFNDFDSIQTPASLTLIGNQGGEHFIAPNIKATNNIYAGTGGDASDHAIYARNTNGAIALFASTNRGLYDTTKNMWIISISADGASGSLNLGSKLVMRNANDNWLRINEGSAFTNGVYFGSSIVRTDGTYIQCGQGSSTSCSWLESTGKVFARRASGEAIIQVDNNNNNKIYMYANSDGRTGIYGTSANGTGMNFISRANNASTFQLGGGSGQVLTYGYNYGAAPPVVSQSTANHRVSHLYMANATQLQVNAQGDTSSYATYKITASSSDIRLKENIVDTKVMALPIINAIKMREFDWKNGEHQKIGMIADEVEMFDKKLAVGGGYNENGDMDIKTIDTFYLMGYLVKAVQELSAKVEELERRL